MSLKENLLPKCGFHVVGDSERADKRWTEPRKLFYCMGVIFGLVSIGSMVVSVVAAISCNSTLAAVESDKVEIQKIHENIRQLLNQVQATQQGQWQPIATMRQENPAMDIENIGEFESASLEGTDNLEDIWDEEDLDEEEINEEPSGNSADNEDYGNEDDLDYDMETYEDDEDDVTQSYASSGSDSGETEVRAIRMLILHLVIANVVNRAF